MSEKQFVDGLIIKPPHEKAPDFVKCAISIKRKDLGNWLRGKSDDWINLDVKVSQGGKWYAEVNDWKPDNPARNMPEKMSPDEIPKGGFYDDDIPF